MRASGNPGSVILGLLLEPWRTEMTSSCKSAPAIAALDYDSTIIGSLELSSTKWLFAAQVPGVARHSRYILSANGDELMALIEKLKARATTSGKAVARVILTFEAGRDGFWLARFLARRGVEVHVMQSSSLPVDRKARRAKTDVIDVLLVAGFWFQRLGRVDRKSKLVGTRRYDGDFEIGCAMNFDLAVEWACGNLAQSAHHEKASAGRLTLAEMPQVDHRIGQRFECVVQLAEAIATKQQAAELIFPAEHTLDGVEPLFENGGVEKRFAASLESFSTAGIRVDIGNHPAIENGFAVSPAIVDAIQADDGSVKVNANSMGDARDQRQSFSQ